MSALRRFTDWVDTGDLSVADLARFRIIYALVALVKVPELTTLAGVPDSWYDPPLGPFGLLAGFPPPWFLTGLELVVTASLVSLLIGWRTRTASIAATLSMIVAWGLVYSQGKVDHNILFVIVPLVMSFSAWGSALSVDAVRSGSGGGTRVPQWPMRYLALLVGVGFMTAAVQKLATGWLSLDSQAALGHMAGNYVQGRDEWLAGYFIQLSWPPFWEALDWATVALEGAVLLAVLSWRVFRVVLAVAALFHLSVLLVMNITFVGNVVVYGAFVTWGRVALPTWSGRISAWQAGRPPVQWPGGGVLVARLAPLLVLGLAPLVMGLNRWWPAVESVLGLGIIFTGGAIAAGYLVAVLLGVARPWSARRSRGPAVRAASSQPG